MSCPLALKISDAPPAGLLRSALTPTIYTEARPVSREFRHMPLTLDSSLRAYRESSIYHASAYAQAADFRASPA